jgi:tetratricopeptide (TPR) repeat protein
MPVRTAGFALILFFASTRSFVAQDLLRGASATPMATLVVSPFADPANWEITGTVKFKPRAISRSLVQHAEFLEVSYPESNRANLVSRLKDLIERGYRNKGFAEATVAISPLDSKSGLAIRIHEGPQYKVGQVEVLGASQIDVEKVQHWCSTVVPETGNDFVLEDDKDGKPLRVRKSNGTIVGPDDATLDATVHKKPLWNAGDPVSFTPAAWAEPGKLIKQAFEAQGFFGVRYETIVVPDPKSKTGVLRISVQDEGSPARVGEITVRGLEEIDNQKLLAALNLKAGQRISGKRCREIERWLINSGRFVRQSCVAVPGILEPDTAEVFLDVRHVPDSPGLDEPLTETQKILLRFSRWLEAREENKFDLIVDLDLTRSWQAAAAALPEALKSLPIDGDVRIVFSPGRDLLLHHTSAGTKLTRTVAIAENTVLLRGQDGSQIIEYEDDVPRPFMQMVVEGLPTNPEGRAFSFKYGLGVQANDEKSLTDIRFLAAAAFKHVADGHLKPVVGKPGQFQIPEMEGGRLELDPTSGRLISLSLGVLKIHSAKGEFKRLFAENLADAISKGGTVRTAGEHETWNLFGLTGKAILGWVADASPQSQTYVAKMNRLSDRAIWSPVATAISDRLGEDRFAIPADGQRIESMMRAHLMNGLVGMVAKNANNAAVAQATVMIAKLCQGVVSTLEIFPYASVPWQLNRDLELLSIDRAAGGAKLLARLKAADFGPVSGLYATFLMTSLSDQLRQGCGQQALSRLDEFERDREWMLAEGSLMAGVLQSTAEAFRRIEPEEVAATLKYVTGRDCLIADAVAIQKTLTASLDEPVELPAFADALWKHAFRPVVRDMLENLILRGAPLEKQANQIVSWGIEKRRRREYPAARKSFQKALEIYAKHLEESGTPVDSAVAGNYRATVRYLIALCHDTVSASRAELMQMQIEIGESIAERKPTGLNFDGQTGVIQISVESGNATTNRQLAQLEGVAGLAAHWLGQESAAAQHYQNSIDRLRAITQKNPDPMPDSDLTQFSCHYALLLATATSPQVHDARKAVQIATEACDRTSHQNVECLEALAAAEAARGNFAVAANWQQKAISLTKPLNRRGKLTVDLTRYRSRQPVGRTTAERRIDLLTFVR